MKVRSVRPHPVTGRFPGGEDNGRIPFVFRIGLVGRGQPAAPAAVHAAADAAIDQVTEYLPGTGLASTRLNIVSMLGEGGEQLVAAAVADKLGAEVEVLLPFPEEGDEEAAHYIADQCDVVVVLGDRRGMQQDGIVRAQDIRQAADEFGRYNAMTVRTAQLRKSAAEAGLAPRDPAAAESRSFLLAQGCLAEWVASYYGRADCLATRLETRFKRLSSAIFLLAAAAVAVVTVQYVFINKEHCIAIGEAVLLLTLLAVTLMTRRRRVLDRWITYRFLAERLRSCYFMALVRQGDRVWRSQSAVSLADPASDWVWRALAEVVARQPAVHIDPSDTRVLAHYLSEQWIQDQLDYHRKRADRQEALDDRLARATWVLFALTLAASIFHILGKQAFPWKGLTGWEEVTVSLSIFLPALGAALHGIRTQAQFHRQHERSTRMAGQLKPLQEQMRQAKSPADIQKVAANAEYLMLQENSEWFGVVSTQDVELITLR